MNTVTIERQIDMKAASRVNIVGSPVTVEIVSESWRGRDRKLEMQRRVTVYSQPNGEVLVEIEKPMEDRDGREEMVTLCSVTA